MSLTRFKDAQNSPDSGFSTAMAELRAGRKTSHWIWYIFPQLAELGRSPTAKFYGIAGPEEAREYLADPLLAERLLEAAGVVAGQLARGVSLKTLMGGTTDALKVVSSLTLFEMAAMQGVAAGANDPRQARLLETVKSVLEAAERQGFPRCEQTLGAFPGRKD